MPLSILFVMRHSGFVRNFEATLDELARRGHRIHLAFELPREQADVADALAARHPGVTWGRAPIRADRWEHLAYNLRAAVDALRYLTPAYADAPKLRARGLRSAPPVLQALAEGPRLLRSGPAITVLDRVLRRALAAIPPDPAIEAFLDERAPDRLLVTPLVSGPTQDDVARSARRRRIPTALPVTSWDNLTNKGLVREPVDRVLVWNEAQRREAIEHHRVPPELVVATGAHTYDHWFAWRPSTTRAEFCANVGLPADRPILLYLCSSKFIAPTEPVFVRRWLQALREGPPELRQAGVLIRPHPASGHWWLEVDLGDAGPVVVWPPAGADPRDPQAKADYYDSMFHAHAAVGVNTSALIELAIVGRPAFTLLAPEFRDTQGGTLHFAHLTDTAGGVLTTAASMPEHHRQLAEALASANGAVPRDAFLRAFIRPHGLDRPAAPLLADEVERLGLAAPVPAYGPLDTVLAAAMGRATSLVTTSGRRRPPRWGLAIRRQLRRARMGKRSRRVYRRARERLGAALGRGV